MNEIKIERTLKRDIDHDIYERAAMFKDGNEYLNFLLELDRRVFGRDDQINGYLPTDEAVKEYEKKTVASIDRRINNLLDEIESNLKFISNCDLDNVKMVSQDSETNLIMIPDDDTIYSSIYLINQIKLLRHFLEKKEK